MRVLTFGEALVGYGSTEASLRTATQFTRFPGGADLNVSVGLARLGVDATWASVLGDDAHGDYLADAVSELGITPLVRRAAGPTALMFKAGGADGDPEVLQVRHDSAFARHADALLTGDVLGMDGIDHLHLTGITLGISPVVRAAALRSAGGRPRCWGQRLVRPEPSAQPVARPRRDAHDRQHRRGEGPGGHARNRRGPAADRTATSPRRSPTPTCAPAPARW